MDGVATVGLASALTATGGVAGAADAYLVLLDHWPVTGNRTQLWTTVRNAAALLLQQGRVRTAALLLARAGAADSASAVGGASGGRLSAAHESLTALLGPAELVEVRAQAGSVPVPDVLDLARAELRQLRDEVLRRADRSTPDWESAP